MKYRVGVAWVGEVAEISLEVKDNSNDLCHNNIWELTGNYLIFSVVMVI